MAEQEQGAGSLVGERRRWSSLRRLTTRGSRAWTLPLMLVLSTGSGMAALIYEIVWFQLLELVIGSTAVSLGVLLATFMGGMCLGSLVFPRAVSVGNSDRFHALRVYGAIELGIGILGILTLLVMPLAGGVYTSWSGDGVGGLLLRGIVAAACLLPPTLLMGATFPALARGLEAALNGGSEGSSPDTATSRGVSWLGMLYGGNIAGAVFGCLLSSFYLLRAYDVATATYVAVAVNVVVAGGAFALAAISGTQEYVGKRDVAGDAPKRDATVYVVIAISGLCALAAEAIWTRLLGLLLGASVYTFAIILAVFLVGLGIGSAAGSLLCRSLERPRRALGWCQLLAAAAIAWSAYNLSASLPYWPVNPSISSNVWFNVELDLARALWALLPPTLLWGASFPLALAAAPIRQDPRPGRAVQGEDGAKLVAGVYAANTMGAIVGALGASLLLVAWAGSQHAQQVLIGLSALAGLLLLIPARLRWSSAVFGTAVAFACGGLIYSVPPVAALLVAHGRYAATWVGKGDVIYVGEGMNSSVAVSRFPDGALTFHVAGKIQASNVARDMRLQRMLGHLTTFTVANPRSVLVIGCGAGITAGAVSIDPRVERETIVEIEPLVPQTAAAYFHEANFDVLANPKVQLRIDDGRHYLLTTKETFDGITIDPLDPWAKGAASLYTREFFDAMKQHLNPGGVVTMYIQLFETNQEAVKSSVATFFEVFPNGTIWGNTYQGQGYDMVLLGQKGAEGPDDPQRIDLDEMEESIYGAKSGGFRRIAESLAEVGMNSAVELFGTYAGRGRDLRAWLRGAAINRDRNLRMQYLAGFELNRDDSAAIYRGMLANRRFPEDLFVSREGRVGELRDAIAGR